MSVGLWPDVSLQVKTNTNSNGNLHYIIKRAATSRRNAIRTKLIIFIAINLKSSRRIKQIKKRTPNWLPAAGTVPKVIYFHEHTTFTATHLGCYFVAEATDFIFLCVTAAMSIVCTIVSPALITGTVQAAGRKRDASDEKLPVVNR